MAIEYLGLSSVEGPLVVLEGVQDAFYDEIVEFVVDHKTKKMGRIVELNEDKAIIQVFEGTENMSLDNTHTRLMGRPMEVTVSPEMLGRTFNGIGQPIDDMVHIFVGEIQVLNIVNDLVKSRADGITIAAGIVTVKHIEYNRLMLTFFIITLHHCQFI